MAGVQGPEGDFSSISFCIVHLANAVAINFFFFFKDLKPNLGFMRTYCIHCNQLVVSAPGTE